LNGNFFHPGQYFYTLTDNEKLSGKLWEEQQKASILDYLPKGAIEPREAAPYLPILHSGDALISNYKNKSNSFEFNANINSNSKIEIPIYDFPNWEVFANGLLIPHDRMNL